MLLIKNGTIVAEDKTYVADLFIKDGIIKEIGTNLEYDVKVIDASGMYVLPGAIDVHTHMDLDVGIAKATDDFYTGTVAAACGGTTTIIDHIGFGPKNCNLKHQIEVYKKLAENKAVIDYGFHGVIQHVNDEILDELSELVDMGITSVKFYMTYGFKLSDSEIFRLMEKAKDLGVILTFHPENDGIINYLRDKFISENKTEPKYHPLSRPEECEAEAISRVLMMASIIKDVPLYIVHLSNGLALDIIKDARERGLSNIYIETCPQYLYLDDSLYSNDDGLKYVMSPPLRNRINNNLLWNGIYNSDIQVIGTDHCPFNYNVEKQLGKDDFTKCPNGAPGVETRPMLMFTKVVEGKLSINKYVDICSTNPAKLFGLYPQKGVIKVGSDADIIIVDPKQQSIITHNNLHENVDYTPYDGIEVNGKVLYTISRGEVIVENNEFIANNGRGKFIKREKAILF
jgi:dihydropyrimidinase